MMVRTRLQHGFSLVEMLSALFIMGFVAAAMGGIVASSSVVSFRTQNKAGALINARRAFNALESEIHNCVFIGNYADSSITFPDKAYPYDPSTFQGYPGNTSNSSWPQQPYSLTGQTLIIQVPVFKLQPSLIVDGATSDGPSAQTNTTFSGFVENSTNPALIGLQNVDTYVYQVLADTSKPGRGQFVLQRTVFPGQRHSGSIETPVRISSNQPQTLLSGIVGPIDPNAAPDPAAGTPPPKVFQYVLAQPSALPTDGATLGIAAPQDLNNSSALGLRGVAVSLELYDDSASTRKDLVPSSLPIRTILFPRANFGNSRAY